MENQSETKNHKKGLNLKYTFVVLMVHKAYKFISQTPFHDTSFTNGNSDGYSKSSNLWKNQTYTHNVSCKPFLDTITEIIRYTG